MNPASMLQQGRVLAGSYRVGRLLGQGGMGAVYEAVQIDLDRKVALKVLHSFGSPEQLERLRREARAAAALGHPNIVQVTDFRAEPGEPPFLVMERLTGTSLGQRIDGEGPLPYARVAFIATQVLAALSAAHRAGIVHRDIKPDNVFLIETAVSRDVVKVVDFGIAKLESSSPITSIGQVIGSPAYMAPEQARGRGVDARSDLFAVGATMYHAVTGRLPEAAAAGGATTDGPRSVADVRPLREVRSDLPAGFIAIVDRAMAQDPASRFASAEEMQSAVAQFCAADPRLQTGPPPAMFVSQAPQPLLAHAPTVAAPLAREKRGAGPWILLAAAVLIAALSIAGLFLAFRGRLASARIAEIDAAPPTTEPSVVPAATSPIAIKKDVPPPKPRPGAVIPSAVPSASAIVPPSPPSPPAPTAPVADAGAPRRERATVVDIGGTYTRYYKGMAPSTAVAKQSGALVSCFNSAPAVPPNKYRQYAVQLDRGVRVQTVSQTLTPPTPALDACVEGVLRQVQFPAFAETPPGPTLDISVSVTWQ